MFAGESAPERQFLNRVACALRSRRNSVRYCIFSVAHANAVRTLYWQCRQTLSIDKIFFVRTLSGMAKRGRPKSEKVKGEYMELRLDVAEKEAFVKAAEAAGMSLSAWVRARLRRASMKELQDMGLPVAFLERLSA